MNDLAARYAPMIAQLADLYSDHEVAHAQLLSLTVTREEWDNDEMRGGHFWFEVTAPAGSYEDISHVNALGVDADGAMIDIIIHPVDGKLNWGEWYRLPRGIDDLDSPIQSWPPVSLRPNLPSQ